MARLHLITLLLIAACAPSERPAQVAPAGASAPAPGAPSPACESAATLRGRAAKVVQGGKLDRTVRLLEKADRLCPAERAESAKLLVSTLLTLGLPERASAAAEERLAERALDPELRRELERLQQRADEDLGRFEQAAKNRHEADALLGRARVIARHRRVAEYPAAVELCEKARSLSPPNGEALLLASELTVRDAAAALWDRARVDFERATGQSARPTHPTLREGMRRLALDHENRVVVVTKAGDEGTVAILDEDDARVVFETPGAAIAADRESAFVANGKVVTQLSRTSGRQLRRFEAPKKVFGLAQAAGVLAATVGERFVDEVIVWKVDRQAIVYRAEASSPLVAVSPDGLWLVHVEHSSTRQLAMKRLDGPEPAVRTKLPESYEYELLASDRFAAMRGGGLVLWELGKPRAHTLVPLPEPGESSPVSGVSLWGNLLERVNDDGVLERWSLTKLRPRVLYRAKPGDTQHCGLTALPLPSDPFGIRSAVCSNGRYLARIRARNTEITVGEWTAPVAPDLSSIRFDDASKQLAVGTAQYNFWENEVRIWDLVKGVPTTRIGVRAHGGAHALDFSPDGRLLAVGTREDVKVHDVASGKVRYSWPLGDAGAVYGVLFSKDAKRLVVLSLGDLYVADLVDGSALRKLAAGISQFAKSNWASAGRSHVIVRGRGGIEIWDVSREKQVLQLPDQYWSLAISGDGKRAAGIDYTRGVRIWQLDAPAAAPKRLEIAIDPGAEIWFSADDQKMLLAGEDKLEIRDWTGKLLHTRDVDDHELAALSPDGKWLAWRADFQTVLWRAADLSPAAALWGVVFDHGAFASVPSGEVEVFEHPAAQRLACRIGAVNHPFHLCQERYQVEGLLQKVLRGDTSYLEP